jgi:hypothetical protein
LEYSIPTLESELIQIWTVLQVLVSSMNRYLHIYVIVSHLDDLQRTQKGIINKVKIVTAKFQDKISNKLAKT